MKKNFLTVFTLAITGSVHGQDLLGDLSLPAYSGQTNIQALKSVTLTNGFYIPVQAAGKTVTISIGRFQTLVSNPTAGLNYLLNRTFRSPGVIRAALNAQCTTRQENNTIQYFTKYYKYDDMQCLQAVLDHLSHITNVIEYHYKLVN